MLRIRERLKIQDLRGNKIAMRKVAIFVILIWSLGRAYAADEDTMVKKGPSPEDIEKAKRESELSRPILPPLVSPGPSMISPTPSPHITVPDITSQQMVQSLQSLTTHPVHSAVPNPPTAPPYAIVPRVSAPVEMLPIPIIGNTIGKVIDKGINNDGSLWFDVDDNLSGEIVRIKIRDTKTVPIVKAKVILNFYDIKIGDAVNATYHTEGDENIANFINVMTEEELELWNQQSTEEDGLAAPSE